MVVYAWLGASIINAFSSTPSGATGVTLSAQTPHQFASVKATKLLEEINAVRAGQNLPELAADSELEAIARLRADDMVEQKYYAHQSSSGKFYFDLLEDHGLRQGYSCENLDLSDKENVRFYLNDWLTSREGHRQCMLNSRVSKVGIFVTDFPNLGSMPANTQKQYLVVAIFQE